MQSGRENSPSILKTQTHPSDHEHRTCLCSIEHVYTAPQSSGGVLYFTPYDAWYWTWRRGACVQQLSCGNPFHEDPFVLTLMPVKIWNSLSMESVEHWRSYNCTPREVTVHFILFQKCL